MIKKVTPENCLAATHPDLAAQWDYEKNTLTPYEVACGWTARVHWKCPAADDHRWSSVVHNRGKHGRGCPFCANQKVCLSNCLATTHPHLAAQWDYEKNTLTPYEVVSGSNKQFYWVCPVAPSHRWRAYLKNRSNHNADCPYCCNKAVCHENCLATTHPDLAAQWDYEKNKLTPYDIVAGSNRSAYWKCNKASDHKWKTTPKDRLQGKGCPYCANQKVALSNCVATTHPHLLAEWDFSKTKVSPYKTTAGSSSRVHWICTKNPKHTWDTRLDSRNSKSYGCPYCNLSKGEEEIRKHLDFLGVAYRRQHRFAECKNVRPLPFDFVLPLRHAPSGIGAIEFQGLQHYEPRPHWGGLKTFKRLMAHDAIKRHFCMSRHIKLLEIPYWQMSEIPQILAAFLNNKTQPSK